MTDPYHTDPRPQTTYYVGCPEDEREQAMAAMRMLVFVLRVVLIVAFVAGLVLAMWWGGA